MAKTKSTKRALIMSLLSLVICITMLIGTTYAWFTDSVTSGNNKIVSGNLDVILEYKNNWDDAWTVVNENTKIFKEGALYEPGYTEVVFLRVSNAGSLALKYNLMVDIASEKSSVNVDGKEFNLSDYLQIGTYTQAEYASGANYADLLMPIMFGSREAALSNVTLAKLATSDSIVSSDTPVLVGEDTAQITALVLTMPTTVGNEANYDANVAAAPEINLGVNLVATQLMQEKDSFNNQYDKDATYPEVDTVERDDDTAEDTLSAGDVDVTVPAGADEGAYKLHVSNENQATDANNNTTVSYDITLTKDGVKVSGNIEFPVSIYVGEGLNITSVKHNGEEIANYTYTSSTGIVSFVTKSFSPFSITYNRGPIADVSNSDITDVNATWGMGGAAKAIELDTAFEFKTTETYDEAQQSEFKYWHADFVVSTDKDVKANSLALAGYYEAYCKDYNNNNWVALISDADIEANTEIRLLELMLNGGSMSYQELCNWVPTFLCGAADLDGSNKGTTLKVELRLYEVENNAASTSAETGEYITVGTYAYTF